MAVPVTGYTELDLVGFTDKGTYNAATTYVANDLVSYNGIKWKCLQDGTVGVTPAEGVSWSVFIIDNEINDNAVSATSTWSSQKINTTKADQAAIAPVENGTTASRAYAIGEHFMKDGAFCTAIAAIAQGATFTLDTNYTAGTVGARVAALESKGEYINADFITYTVAANSVRTTMASIDLLANHTYIVSAKFVFTAALNSTKVMGLVDNVGQIYNANGMVDGGGMVITGLYKPSSNETISLKIEQANTSARNIASSSYFRAYRLD